MNIGEDVKNIIKAVHACGDTAISKFTLKFDRIKINPKEFKVSEREIKESLKKIDSRLYSALKRAKQNIESFQKNILPKQTVISGNGVKIKNVFLPVESAGIYVPGGRFPYPSTVLMTSIPALVAGVKKVVMVTPPKNLTAPVLAAAHLCGITEIYRIGGVQAIAALACGTRTIPKVDIIVGPGNKYVAEAKRQLFGEVGIDMIAGPSEILIMADTSANPEFVVSDLMAQCEHDSDAGAVLLSFSRKLSEYCIKNTLSVRKQIKILDVKSIDEAIHIANRFAPEHLEIMMKNAHNIVLKIKNAGAVFLGNYTPVAIGDYYAGPSHVLPTGGSAKFSSGLSVYSFLKKVSIIEYTKASLRKISSDVINIANTEGLVKHAESLKRRI
ncbi:MAG: Histidinol dehydrogenase [Elusimicrobia bacterium ADurb.Bin231]|nr:MAG: Histidinol dehydrogenase [Elusimicrobia bacterium ADurb.Bin231]